ncbi:hypothetical protein BSKO_07611 [Bryopsis sp. KO-2023]|nr:hypothetical protein BSKO_07611 [Bryopsis sp. KO-2023]
MTDPNPRGWRLRDESLVLVLQVLPAERHFLLISLATREDVQLVRFDPVSGALSFRGEKGFDVFDSDGEALSYLKLQGSVKHLGKGKSALGYVVVGNTGLLLLAENASVSALLPGGHQIRTVTNTAWYRIPCQADIGEKYGLTREELDEKAKKITDFPINGAHWYCETVDVSRPFPSEKPVTDPSFQFVWNAWLSESFRSVGLDKQCPALLQGTAEIRELEDVTGESFNLVLVSRRSRLHPGTRYIARGLNDEGEPGNEIECEQIIWRTGETGDDPIPWSRYAWRRGTVPIRWGVTIRNGGLGEAEISIRREKTFMGTKEYVRRVQKRFCPDYELEQGIEAESSRSADSSTASTSGYSAFDDRSRKLAAPGPGVDPSKSVPVAFVSLLRKGTPDRDRSEGKLATAFDQALLLMRRECQLPTTYFALDWHEMDKQLGTCQVIEALWSLMKSTVESHGFAAGHFIPQSVDQKVGEVDESRRTWWGGRLSMCWLSQQKGVARYNCADSLDRTNVASFFMSVQIFVEQCRRMGLTVVSDGKGFNVGERVQGRFKGKLWGKPPATSNAKQPPHRSLSPEPKTQFRSHSPRLRSKTPPPPEVRLPEGWERRRDDVTGNVYYIDHKNKRTSWTPPETVKSFAKPASVSTKGSSNGTRSNPQPTGLRPYELLEAKVDIFKKKVLPEALTTFAEIFLMSGDRNAFFYTGSQAMHSEKIMIFEPETSQLRKSGAGGISNWSIAISRRYNNVMRDNDRQAQIEMFLGLYPEKHFLTSHPTLGNTQSGPLLYKAPSCLPLDHPDTDDDDELISQMSYPPPLTLSNSTETDLKSHPILPYSHSNTDLDVMERELPPSMDDQVWARRSFSESTLGHRNFRLLEKEVGGGGIPKSDQNDVENLMESQQGLREVPVDVSPLALD